MDRRRAERVSYQNGIWDIRSFGQSKTQMLRSVQPLFYPETEFISDVDRQNSVTSKPFSRHSHMSNG
jgi:hypothetical protein